MIRIGAATIGASAAAVAVAATTAKGDDSKKAPGAKPVRPSELPIYPDETAE